MSLSIVFHGSNAAVFADGIAARLTAIHSLSLVPDLLQTEADKSLYQHADVIVGISYNATLPRPAGLKLYHVPGAGTDGIDRAALPEGAQLCNCFGHEQPIAEYVMAALLNRAIPARQADEDLRQGRWTYWAGGKGSTHHEIAGMNIGLLGFGHIGKAIAKRAKAFDMRVLVANRSAVPPSDGVDAAYSLDAMDKFWHDSDAIVCSLPLTTETKGLVGAEAFAKMKASAVIINVGRGPVIEEDALYQALAEKRIGGAIIDTWYQYPSADKSETWPAHKPFHTLSNLVMTPHMSGWTDGTIRRRRDTIADNINRLVAGKELVNTVR